MLLNAFDVDPGADERTLELRHGEFQHLGLKADLLVVSGGASSPKGPLGSLASGLERDYGIALSSLPQELDLRGTSINAWISPPLPQPHGRVGSPPSRFNRLAVIEASASAEGSDDWPAFRQLFCLLAVLPLHGIHCPVVASPLLSAPRKSRAEHHDADLLACARNGFRHVPDLERLILFDRRLEQLESLAKCIDLDLGRDACERELLAINDSTGLLDALRAQLDGFERRHALAAAGPDLDELSHLLKHKAIAPVALGMHGRRLVERLVRQQLGHQKGSLYRGLQALQQRGVNPWVMSCLHQVRVFGNWMGHPSDPASRQSPTETDLVATLAALQRILEAYPWL